MSEHTISEDQMRGLADSKITKEIWIQTANGSVEAIGEKLEEADLGLEAAEGRFANDPDFHTVDEIELREMLRVAMEALGISLNLNLAAKMIMVTDNILMSDIDTEMADPEVFQRANEVKEQLDEVMSHRDPAVQEQIDRVLKTSEISKPRTDNAS